MSASTDNIVDVCVVGAGLSGAYAAHRLLANSSNKSVAVVDARHRIGGRLLTAEEQGGGDLGGAWIWPRSEYVMKQFVQQLDIKTVAMHLDGETMARTPDGKRHVLPPGEASRYAACGGGAVRVSGGAASMVQKLLQCDHPNLSIHLGMEVVRIEHDGDLIKVICKDSSELNKGNEILSIKCRTAILAAPPKALASTIEFNPPLSKVKMDSMRATPTWMGEYGKVSVSFPRNWWRELNMSAISIDQIGSVQTWWEACSGNDGDGSYPTLAGFVTARGAKALKKMKSAEAMYDYILDSLTKLYGVDSVAMGLQKDMDNIEINGSADTDGLIVSKGGLTVTYKSWLEDRHTNTASCAEIDFTTDYGDRDLQQNVGPLFFAGTETALGSGHMEGAIISAKRAADEVIQYLN